MSAFTQGLMQGSNFVQQGQVNQARQSAFGAQQKQIEQQGQADALNAFKETVNSGVAYISQLPPQERQPALQAYFMNNGQGEAFERLAQSGMLSDLSDQRLQAYLASTREEQVLKDDEVLLGRDGQAVFSNRGPETVADGATLTGPDGTVLYDNPKDFAPPQTPADIQLQEYYGQNPEAFARAKELKE